jgi:hypothetical protein
MVYGIPLRIPTAEVEPPTAKKTAEVIPPETSLYELT